MTKKWSEVRASKVPDAEALIQADIEKLRAPDSREPQTAAGPTTLDLLWDEMWQASTQPAYRRRPVWEIRAAIEADAAEQALREPGARGTGIDMERWIDSLHEDANGAVWITKAELRSVLRLAPDPGADS